MTELLVQTRLPKPIGEWVLRVAAAEGVSTAAWLRRAVMGIAEGTRIEAWFARPGESLDSFHYSAPRVHVTLQLLERGAGGRCLFSPMHPPTHSHAGQPWSEAWFKDSDLFRAQQQRVLVLRGSPVPWRILSSMFDSSEQRLLLLAEPVSEPSQVRILLDELCDFVRRRLAASHDDPRDLSLELTEQEEQLLLGATASDVGDELAGRLITEGPRGVFSSLFGIAVSWGGKSRSIGPRRGGRS